MYQLVRQRDPSARGRSRSRFFEAGAEAYAFTFG
jgi:hypothetical protein